MPANRSLSLPITPPPRLPESNFLTQSVRNNVDRARDGDRNESRLFSLVGWWRRRTPDGDDLRAGQRGGGLLLARRPLVAVRVGDDPLHPAGPSTRSFGVTSTSMFRWRNSCSGTAGGSAAHRRDRRLSRLAVRGARPEAGAAVQRQVHVSRPPAWSWRSGDHSRRRQNVTDGGVCAGQHRSDA
jgi:hypothetical protein